MPLDKIPYVDFPELKFNEHESTEMPFRYVTDGAGNPIMPAVRTPRRTSEIPTTYADLHDQGMKELIQKDTDKAVDDLF